MTTKYASSTKTDKPTEMPSFRACQAMAHVLDEGPDRHYYSVHQLTHL